MWEFGSILTLILTIGCLVHLIRNGRAFWWIFIFIFFPGIGAIVYFIVEILPDLRGRDFQRGVADVKDRLMTPDARIHALEKELQVADTVEKRTELAEAYGQAERWADALDTYRGCVEGPLGDDPFLLFGFARAAFHAGNLDEALQALHRIDQGGSRDKLEERRLLRARIFWSQGDTDSALEQFEAVADTFPGEEGRFRYAELLSSLGRGDDAVVIWKDMVETMNQHSPLYRKQNRHWFQEARKKLQESRGDAGR